MANTDWQFLRWQIDEGVGRLTLSRPPLNALDIATLRELETVLETAACVTTLRGKTVTAAEAVQIRLIINRV